MPVGHAAQEKSLSFHIVDCRKFAFRCPGIVLVDALDGGVGVLYPVHDGGVCVAKYIAVGRGIVGQYASAGIIVAVCIVGLVQHIHYLREPEELVKPVAVTSRVGRVKQQIAVLEICGEIVGRYRTFVDDVEEIRASGGAEYKAYGDCRRGYIFCNSFHCCWDNDGCTC